MYWDLQGTARQQAIVREALGRCDFPWDRLSISRIPVEWADLSRYTQQLAEAKASGGHLHIHEEGDTAHPVERRERVLGLAWYSGKVTLERTLESDPELAAEVFLSEGAHMVDFFYMENRHRVAVWNAVHPEHEHIHPEADVRDGVDLGHGHSWFDVGQYEEWVGEEFMGLFVKAFSDVQLTIDMAHGWDPDAAQQVREAFLGINTPEQLFFGLQKSKVYHDSHAGIPAEVTWVSWEAAERAGRRPCRTCKPRG